MNAVPSELPVSTAPLERSRLAARLRRVIKGQVLFDAFSRARYSTDASIYQVRPIGVVVPADEHDYQAAVEIAAELRIPMVSRGGGGSVSGQTLGEALVIDCSRLDRVLGIDARAMRAEVQPGVLLDRLNAALEPHGLWFPVDVEASAVATLGGMAGNNAAGVRSMLHGSMVHHVVGIDAILADGSGEHFGAFGLGSGRPLQRGRSAELVSRLFMIAGRERDEIERVWPRSERRAGGYNLDIFHPQSGRPYTSDGSVNLSHLLVGSEGTLAHFRRLHLKLSPLPALTVLGVVNFPDLGRAMVCTRAITDLRPSAVELVDRMLIDAARADTLSRPAIESMLIERPAQATGACLLVEFCGDSRAALLARLRDLEALMAELGLPGTVKGLTEARAQRAVWQARRAGLARLSAMQAEGQPVCFIEDCAVPLEHLPEYVARLDEIIRRHRVRAVWSGQAGAGALQVRPILDMRTDGVATMRAMAEEVADCVRGLRGAFSSGQGVGLARSEWVARQFGLRINRAFEEVKDLFDPQGLMNPGKIVRAPRMDEPKLLRQGKARSTPAIETTFEWAASPAGSFSAAADRCDGNGRCRSLDAGVMCPSFRALRQEQHSPRGRANSLRLALSGQLGKDAMFSQALHETLAGCVGCKACRSECPQGIDISRMKIEFLSHYRKQHGLRLRERLIANLPRYAGLASRLAPIVNGLAALPGAPWLRERILGLAAQRRLPRWSSRPFTRDARLNDPDSPRLPSERAVLLWADTFNNHFEPEVLRSARRVLEAAGKTVIVARASPGDPEPRRPLCCGRTWLAVGQIERARAEIARTLHALSAPGLEALPVVGLEPACLLTFRDEALALGLGDRAAQLSARSVLFEEYMTRERSSGRLELPVVDQSGVSVHCHAHCHQKAFGTASQVLAALKILPGATVHAIESGCCGMAGSFGFQSEMHSVSKAIASLDLLPALGRLSDQAIIVADGTSCRHLIHDDAGRRAWHVAQILDRALDGRIDGRSA